MPSRSSRAPSKPRPLAYLFTYGTLMRGYGLHRVLAPGATFEGEGSVPGRLLDLGRYPGLIAGRGRVRGELYGLHRAELLPVLDREEGYNFVRGRTTVMLEGGRRVSAWLYRYRGPRDRAIPIPHGDYRRLRWR
jgi:gamma-glutamylcyclotransferase (GGCT)/AIG2-like uncharacterized protein YtfP